MTKAYAAAFDSLVQALFDSSSPRPIRAELRWSFGPAERETDDRTSGSGLPDGFADCQSLIKFLHHAGDAPICLGADADL